MEATPTVLMSMWAAGLAAGGSIVVAWRVVGPGYVWLTSAVLGVVGLALGLLTGSVAAWVGAALSVTAAFTAGHPGRVFGAFAASSILFIWSGIVDSPLLPLVTGAVFLGFVTTEMMLGHWFLVDPTLPRWSLNRLALIGGAGLAADVVVLLFLDLPGGAGSDPVLGWAYGALAVMTALLVVGVVMSLREPSYTGVMAATGLSYLAVLTAFGVTVAGRMLAT